MFDPGVPYKYQIGKGPNDSLLNGLIFWVPVCGTSKVVQNDVIAGVPFILSGAGAANSGMEVRKFGPNLKIVGGATPFGYWQSGNVVRGSVYPSSMQNISLSALVSPRAGYAFRTGGPVLAFNHANGVYVGFNANSSAWTNANSDYIVVLYNSVRWINTSILTSTSAFNHITLVVRAGKPFVYLNGVMSFTDTGASPNNATADYSFLFGEGVNGPWCDAKQFRAWNRALSDSEAKRLYETDMEAQRGYRWIAPYLKLDPQAAAPASGSQFFFNPPLRGNFGRGMSGGLQG